VKFYHICNSSLLDSELNVSVGLYCHSSSPKESPLHKRGIRDLPMPPLLPSAAENIGFPEDSDDVASPSDDSDSSVNFDHFHEAWERRKKL